MINWTVKKRANTLRDKKYEYALYATDDVTSIAYTLFTWNKKPSISKIKKQVLYLTQAMKFAFEIQTKPSVYYSVCTEIEDEL